MAECKYRNREYLYSEYYEKNRSITDIADELGVDHTTISKWRRKLDVPKPSRVVELECPVCGSVFERYKSKVERVKYTNVCSLECLYEGRSSGVVKREVSGGYDTSPTVFERECNNCGSTFHTTASEDYEHCSRQCFLELHSERMAGENNPAYVDGSSKEKRSYRGPNWAQIRAAVYDRDEYTCRRCGVRCISRRDYDGSNGSRIIQAHHVGGYEDESDNRVEEIVTLCAECHGKVEGGANLNVE